MASPPEEETSGDTPSLPRLERLPRVDEGDLTNDTFVLHGHDHTLGNPLRHMILKEDKTEFCGYSIIHPTEDNIHLRIQTREERDPTAASEVLKSGLESLKDVCQFISLEYDDALATYKANQQN